jgi:hypothetical protein
MGVTEYGRRDNAPSVFSKINQEQHPSIGRFYKRRGPQ